MYEVDDLWLMAVLLIGAKDDIDGVGLRFSDMSIYIRVCAV